MTERGVIQFECRWTNGPAPDDNSAIKSLTAWRRRMAALGLIGVTKEGIGFGNISVRHVEGCGEFVISGSQTGALKSLTRAHLSVVTDFNLDENWVACRGPVRASSESLTHGIVYRLRPDVGGVIHVHNIELWAASTRWIPRTRPEVEAGTPEMADEVARVLTDVSSGRPAAINMGGHEGGLIAVGPSLDTAGDLLVKLLERAEIDVRKSSGPTDPDAF